MFDAVMMKKGKNGAEKLIIISTESWQRSTETNVTKVQGFWKLQKERPNLEISVVGFTKSSEGFTEKVGFVLIKQFYKLMNFKPFS